MKTLGSAEGHWVNTGSEYINTEYSDSAVGMFVEPLRRHTCLLAPTMPRIPGKAGDEDTRLAPESSFGRRGGRVGRRFGCDGQHAGRKKSGTRCEASDNAKGPAGFARGRDGSTTIETALAISVLVALFAGLLAIVQERYSADRLARAARAAARAVALDPSADYCAAIRRELGLAEDFDCGDQWAVTVEEGLSPSALSAALRTKTSAAVSDGEMVLVRIAWRKEAEQVVGVQDVPMTVMALAYREQQAG